jgi:hypothetical protein
MPRFGEPDTELDPATGRYGFVPVLAELRRRIAKGKPLDLECWRTILIDKGFLRWRRDWPLYEPFAVSLHLPAIEDGLRVCLVPRVRDWKPARASHWETMCGLGTDSLWQAEDYQVLGRLGLDVREISFDLLPVFDSGSWDRGRTALVQGVGPIRIEVRPALRTEGILHRRRSSPPAQEIVRALHVELDARAESGKQVRLVAHAPTWPDWLACSLEVTLIGGYPPPPTANLWLRSGRADPSCTLVGLSTEDVRDQRFVRCWKVHLQGTFDGALRDWDATQYWAGAIDVPLADLIRR